MRAYFKNVETIGSVTGIKVEFTLMLIYPKRRSLEALLKAFNTAGMGPVKVEFRPAYKRKPRKRKK